MSIPNAAAEIAAISFECRGCNLTYHTEEFEGADEEMYSMEYPKWLCENCHDKTTL